MPRSKKEIQAYYSAKIQEANISSPQEMKRTALNQVAVSSEISSLPDQPSKKQVGEFSSFLDKVSRNEIIPGVFRTLCKNFATWVVEEPPSQSSPNATTPTTISNFSSTPRNAYQSQSTTRSIPTSNTSSPQLVSTTINVSNSPQTQVTRTNQPTQTINVSNSPQTQVTRTNQPTQTQPRLLPSVPQISPSQGTGNQSPNDLIESRRNELMELRDYSVENYKGHEHLIPEGKEFSSWVEGKFKNVKKSALLEVGQVGSSAQPNVLTSLYSWPTIKMTAQKVQRLKCAVCTAFALTSAYILCKDVHYRGPRVEIVSQPGHVFVIVGRAGNSCAGGKMPSYSNNKQSWGNKFFVVDAWLGALGQHVIFGHGMNGESDYLMTLDDLNCHWDSAMLEQV